MLSGHESGTCVGGRVVEASQVTSGKWERFKATFNASTFQSFTIPLAFINVISPTTSWPTFPAQIRRT